MLSVPLEITYFPYTRRIHLQPSGLDTASIQWTFSYLSKSLSLHSWIGNQVRELFLSPRECRRGGEKMFSCSRINQGNLCAAKPPLGSEPATSVGHFSSRCWAWDKQRLPCCQLHCGHLRSLYSDPGPCSWSVPSQGGDISNLSQLLAPYIWISFSILNLNRAIC